jgi:hypothetical protein
MTPVPASGPAALPSDADSMEPPPPPHAERSRRREATKRQEKMEGLDEVADGFFGVILSFPFFYEIIQNYFGSSQRRNLLPDYA